MENAPSRGVRLCVVAAGLCVLVMSGCTGAFLSQPAEVARATPHVTNGPPQLTLITRIHAPTAFPWHSALMIDNGERVLFDAGGFWNPEPSRRYRDIHYGFDDAQLEAYMRPHTFAGSWHVVTQTIVVPQEVAQMVRQRAEEHSLVLSGTCAIAVANLLDDLPGFESIGLVTLPQQLMEQFAELDEVHTEVRLAP